MKDWRKRTDWYDLLTALELFKKGYLTVDEMFSILQKHNTLDDYQAEITERGKANDFA